MRRAVHVDIGSWRVRFNIDEGTVKYDVLGYDMLGFNWREWDMLGFNWREWGRGKGLMSGV